MEELGEGSQGGAYCFSSDFKSTPVNAQCQLSRRAQENLSVFLSHSIVGGWCLFILPGKDLMNLCPSVQIWSFLAATSSSFQAFVSSLNLSQTLLIGIHRVFYYLGRIFILLFFLRM